MFTEPLSFLFFVGLSTIALEGVLPKRYLFWPSFLIPITIFLIAIILIETENTQELYSDLLLFVMALILLPCSAIGVIVAALRSNETEK
jgi:hypothetical protein